MSREYPQMRIRLSPELKDKIEAEAKANGRSMNAEISARLEHSLANDFAAEGSLPSAEELKSISTYAIEDLKAETWKAVTQEIMRAAKLGFSEAWLDYGDFDGFDVERPEHMALAKEFEAQLQKMGYQVKEDDLTQRVVSW